MCACQPQAAPNRPAHLGTTDELHFAFTTPLNIRLSTISSTAIARIRFFDLCGLLSFRNILCSYLPNLNSLLGFHLSIRLPTNVIAIVYSSQGGYPGILLYMIFMCICSCYSVVIFAQVSLRCTYLKPDFKNAERTRMPFIFLFRAFFAL